MNLDIKGKLNISLEDEDTLFDPNQYGDGSVKDEEEFDLLKMDIQGHEFHALKGMGDLLDRQGITVVMEFWPKALKEAGSDPVELLAYLISKGFEIRDSENQSEVIGAKNSTAWAASITHYTNLILKK